MTKLDLKLLIDHFFLFLILVRCIFVRIILFFLCFVFPFLIFLLLLLKLYRPFFIDFLNKCVNIGLCFQELLLCNNYKLILTVDSYLDYFFLNVNQFNYTFSHFISIFLKWVVILKWIRFELIPRLII